MKKPAPVVAHRSEQRDRNMVSLSGSHGSLASPCILPHLTGESNQKSLNISRWARSGPRTLTAYLGLEAFELFALMDTVEAEGFNLCLTPAGGVYQPRDEREYQEFMRRVMENGRPSEWTEGDQAKEEHRGREMQTVNNGPALPTRYAPESSPTAYMAMMRERGKADPDICAARRLAVKRFH